MNKILIIAEHDGKNPNPNLAPVIGAAGYIHNAHIDILVCGDHGVARHIATEIAAYDKINQVLVSSDESYTHILAENMASLVVSLADQYDYILTAASFFGKNILPRVAGILDIQPLSDVTQILGDDVYVRPIYAGNAFATVQLMETKRLISIRPTAFEPCSITGGQAKIIEIQPITDYHLSRFMNSEIVKTDRPDLQNAEIVISGGRALGSAEQFNNILIPLAEKLNAAIGASRAAVDAGYAPNDYQVGQTGKIIAPKLYIAIGISGAIQHIAGMKDSKIIVAINKDPDAPIFKVSDYGIVGDLFEIVPELLSLL
jgi:electron transfer flavoprotein alpha subunit